MKSSIIQARCGGLMPMRRRACSKKFFQHRLRFCAAIAESCSTGITRAQPCRRPVSTVEHNNKNLLLKPERGDPRANHPRAAPRPASVAVTCESDVFCSARLPLLARNGPTDRAHRCPQLEQQRTSRGRTARSPFVDAELDLDPSPKSPSGKFGFIAKHLQQAA